MEAVDELVDLLAHRVEVEACTIRGRDAELLHQRLAAVMAFADRYALHVENLGDIVRMDALDVERHDARTSVRRRPVQREPVELAEAAEGIRGDLVVVCLDCNEPNCFDVCYRSSEPDT